MLQMLSMFLVLLMVRAVDLYISVVWSVLEMKTTSLNVFMISQHQRVATILTMPVFNAKFETLHLQDFNLMVSHDFLMKIYP